jgi:hypothetical protein
MRTSNDILSLKLISFILPILLFFSCVSDIVKNKTDRDNEYNEDIAVTNQSNEDNAANKDIGISTEPDTIHLHFNTGMTLFWQKQKQWSRPRVLLGSTLNNTIDSIYYLNDTALENSFKVYFRDTIYINFYKNNLDDITTAFVYFLIIDKRERTIGYYLRMLKPDPDEYDEYDAIIEQSLIECIEKKRNEIIRKTPKKNRYYYIFNAIQLLG